MFFSPNICPNPVNNPKLYPTFWNYESTNSGQSSLFDENGSKKLFLQKLLFLMQIFEKFIDGQFDGSFFYENRNFRSKL